MSFLLEVITFSEDSLQIILDETIKNYQNNSPRQIQPEGPPLIAWVFILAPVILVSSIYFKGWFEQKRLDELWRKGVFPNYKEFERDYLLEAYIRMGVLLMIHDRAEIREKQKLILAHAYKYFPESELDFGEVITKAYKHPIKPKSVALWVRKFIRNRNSRLQFVYFLIGVATKDGDINYREEQVIREFGINIGLNPKELDRLISMYSFRNKRKTTPPKKRASIREIACKILGISTAASQSEIKKAYRSLVKKYHPDRMVGSSAAEVKIARERFMEIQKAYDYLNQFS